MIAWIAAARADDPLQFVARIDQAKLDIKREWWDDARTQLEAAVATPDGALDPEAWLLLATVRYRLCDVPGARFAADRAHSNSRDLDQAGQAAGLRDWIDQSFGAVVVDAPYDGVATRVGIELVGTLLDPDLKAYAARLQDRYADRVPLPVTLWLPASSWRIAGQDVDVAAGATVHVVPKVATGILQASALELGFGPTFWVGRDTAALLPVPTTAVALSLPIGPLILGITGAWTPQPYRTATDAIQVDAGGYELGGRVGFEIPHTDPLVTRISAGYAYGVVPGVELPCAASGSGWTCGAASSAALYVHAPARAHLPRLEVAAIYQERAKNARFGAGLVAVAELAVGRIAGGQALAPDGTDYSWVPAAGADRFTGLGLRGLGTLTLAF